MPKSGKTERDHPTETPDVSHVKNVDVTHEASDVNVGAILTFVAALTVLSIGVCAGLYFLFYYYSVKEDAKEPPPGPMAITKKEDRLPPEPRLQNAPGFGLKLESGEVIDLEKREPEAEYLELRKQWEKTLNEGLRDQSNRVVGLPIEEAMRIIAQGNTVPSRSSPTDARSLDEYGISIPTSASSGRISEKVR
jgi:hypothetical protein